MAPVFPLIDASPEKETAIPEIMVPRYPVGLPDPEALIVKVLPVQL